MPTLLSVHQRFAGLERQTERLLCRQTTKPKRRTCIGTRRSYATDLEAELREAKAQADKLPAEEAENLKEETAIEGEEKSDPTLTTKVPSEHDLEWYKKAYEQSTTEALRLKGELDKKVEALQ
jgi:hypothetical protein